MHFFFHFSAFPSIVSSTHTTFSYKYVLFFPPPFLLYLLSSAQITFHLSFCTFVPKIISFCTSFPFVFHTNSYIFSFKYLCIFFSSFAFLLLFFFLLCRFPKVLILYIPQWFPYILISKHTVMAKNIGTVGKYNQRKLWKLICIVNPFDLLLKKKITNLTFHWIIRI